MGCEFEGLELWMSLLVEGEPGFRVMKSYRTERRRDFG